MSNIVKVKLCKNKYNPTSNQDEPGETIDEADGLLVPGGVELLPGHFLHAPAGEKVWIVFPSSDGDLHAVLEPDEKECHITRLESV